jgi:pimeloyl-ACP methyl ester carboxylesterase
VSGPSPETPPPREHTTAQAAAEDFIAPSGISSAMTRAFVSAALAADPIKTDWRAFDQFDVLDPAKIVVPTLLLQGELDPYTKVAFQVALFTHLGTPDRQWVVLPGADHAAHLEAVGARLIETVVCFLERSSRRAPAARSAR